MAELLNDRYECLETLGAGGEARVVKALDRRHGRFVALKIRPSRDGHAREELLGEARIPRSAAISCESSSGPPGTRPSTQASWMRPAR
jgi:hypothetical protein